MLKWQRCFDCGQSFHSAVKLALAWACWKTYLGLDGDINSAMGLLGVALCESGSEEGLPVLEAQLALSQRYWSHHQESVLHAQYDYANALLRFDRLDEGLCMLREIHEKRVALFGPEQRDSIGAANSLAIALVRLARFDEARAILKRQIPLARQLGGTQWVHAAGVFSRAVVEDDNCPTTELEEALTVMDDASRTARQTLGTAHPVAKALERDLGCIRARLT
mmetsp:Transcript_26288/g.78913  ORF Transcript_26288/g.78913 Transcript_26288/m.78913 type:complete len:222 (+) Transcript_26288:3-668(+)